MNDHWTKGYCTNVHAGTSVEEIRGNLDRVAVSVREQLGTNSLGVGLWIPDQAAQQLENADASEGFRDWLIQRQLLPFTINGFPQGNFHQPVVKHRVYEPTWWDPSRLHYTLRLADILNRILPGNEVGSISTLPIGWGTPRPSEDRLQQAATNLKTVSEHLRRIEQQSGRRIVLAIEPEPGCVIDVTADMIAFFDRFLPSADDRRYLTVCHDVCHAAVMYEAQADVIKQYADAGIGIGKVQVSSAIDVRWHQINDGSLRQATLEQLKGFAEDRYLHQTVRHRADGSHQFVEDLPELLSEIDTRHDDRSWRIHFHVPIYLDSFGYLHGTRDAVVECFTALRSTPGLDFTGHLEAETYAWGVLPSDLMVNKLATGIASELRWLGEQGGSR